MKYIIKNFILSVLILVFSTGCFNHTIPTGKRLDKGEEIWGASFGIPIFSSDSWDDEETESPDPAREFSWSFWYGNGATKYSDYYVFLGELGGIGFLVNSEIRHSSISSVVLNYGIGTVNGIYGFRPKIGINYSDGNGATLKQIGFLTGIAYDISEEEPELIGDYALYAGLDKNKTKHFFFGSIGLLKVNTFSHKIFHITISSLLFSSSRAIIRTRSQFPI